MPCRRQHPSDRRRGGRAAGCKGKSCRWNITKSSAEGLGRGLDNAIPQLPADQADKVRDCLKPVRERLLDALLPVSSSARTNPDVDKCVNAIEVDKLSVADAASL